MGIADNIRKASLEKSNENLPQGSNTAQLQKQIATGATGKGQSADQGLKQSNIAEQIGMVEARGAQQDVAQQGLDAASTVASKEAEVEVKQKGVETANRIKEMEQDTQMADQLDSVMSEIEYSDTVLEDRKDAAQLEAIGRTLRLNDQKYRHELQQIGTRERLDNSERIAREATRLELGERTSRMMDQIDFDSEMTAQDRAGNEKKLIMKAEDAYKIAAAAHEDEMAGIKMNTVLAVGEGAFDAYGGTAQLKKDYNAGEFMYDENAALPEGLQGEALPGESTYTDAQTMQNQMGPSQGGFGSGNANKYSQS